MSFKVSAGQTLSNLLQIVVEYKPQHGWRGRVKVSLLHNSRFNQNTLTFPSALICIPCLGILKGIDNYGLRLTNIRNQRCIPYDIKYHLSCQHTLNFNIFTHNAMERTHTRTHFHARSFLQTYKQPHAHAPTHTRALDSKYWQQK